MGTARLQLAVLGGQKPAVRADVHVHKVQCGAWWRCAAAADVPDAKKKIVAEPLKKERQRTFGV